MDEIEIIEVAPDEAADERAGSRRGRLGVVAAVVAVLALVAAGVWLTDDADVEVAIDEDGTSTTTTAPSPELPEPDGAPAPIALGAPDDGKDSIGLPVDADQRRGLTDGQTITVTGAQFPPNEQVGVVMCTKEAGQDHGGRGVDACNIGHFAQGTSGPDGNVSLEFSVRRLVSLDGQEVDCASEEQRCLVGMGLLSDYDQSGGVLVSFDPSVPLPDPPTASLTQSEGLVDGQTVGLQLSGLVPNSEVWVELCADQACAAPGGAVVTAGPDGTVDTEIRVWRSFGAWLPPEAGGPSNLDCAVEACRLHLNGQAPGGRSIPALPLGFDADGVTRPAPTMRVLGEGPFAPGDTFRVEISGATPRSFVEVQVCTSQTAPCIAQGSAELTGSDTAVVDVTVTDPGDAACGTACPLLAMIHSYAGPGVDTPSPAPPLFPEPVTVAITGG